MSRDNETLNSSPASELIGEKETETNMVCQSQNLQPEYFEENVEIGETLGEVNIKENILESHEEAFNDEDDIPIVKSGITSLVPDKETKVNWQKQIDVCDERKLYEQLKHVSEEELLEILKETEKTNSYLLKESNLYEFILNEDDMIQNTLERVEEEDSSVQGGVILSYPVKCYFARKRLEHIEKEFEYKKEGYVYELQNLRCKLESLDMCMKDLEKTKEKFNKNIETDGRHPVTKRIILQKVVKFFDDSIKQKMALANQYRVEIQSDIKERNKILSQIKAQEKRLASLDMTEFQKAQFEHKKSCNELAMCKEQLAKFKAKLSPLLQSLTEMKRALQREESEMKRLKNAVSKLEHLKEVMLKEKAHNDQKVLEMENAIRKIKLDPRRHNLPEVIDYAAAKRENAAIKRSIKQSEKKVASAKQRKSLYLSSLSKKENV